MIYLDYNATTPIEERVKKVMKPYIEDYFGNPSSNHELGYKTKTAVENARRQVADLINCDSEEIIFTSGGSESNNMVLKGTAYIKSKKGKHIITSKIEHPAILNPCRFLSKSGYDVTYVSVDKYGMVNAKDIEDAIREDTILITIMHSNNETGTLQPIKEIGKIAEKYNILFHTDASQSIGKVPINVEDLKVDFLTIAGHKVYAPKGIGALYIRKEINIEPLIHGASHESSKRAGTENVIFDVALGEACAIAKEKLKDNSIKELTDYFYKGLLNIFGHGIRLNGHEVKRLPNTLNISFIGKDGIQVLDKLEGVAASTGSACHSGLTSISPVLRAMKVPDDVATGAVRFSLGRYTSKEDIDMVLEKLKDINLI